MNEVKNLIRLKTQINASVCECHGNSNYRVAFFLNSWEKRRAALDYVQENVGLFQVKKIEHFSARIHFYNGSILTLLKPEIQGIEVHKVWIDEDIEDNMKQYLKTRERL